MTVEEELAKTRVELKQAKNQVAMLTDLWKKNAPRYRDAPCECRMGEDGETVLRWCAAHASYRDAAVEARAEIARLRHRLRELGIACQELADPSSQEPKP